MQNKSMGDTYGVEELPLDIATAVEGGGPILVGIVIGLTLYVVNNAGEFVNGLVDGWNAYQQ